MAPSVARELASASLGNLSKIRMMELSFPLETRIENYRRGGMRKRISLLIDEGAPRTVGQRSILAFKARDTLNPLRLCIPDQDRLRINSDNLSNLPQHSSVNVFPGRNRHRPLSGRGGFQRSPCRDIRGFERQKKSFRRGNGNDFNSDIPNRPLQQPRLGGKRPRPRGIGSGPSNSGLAHNDYRPHGEGEPRSRDGRI